MENQDISDMIDKIYNGDNVGAKTDFEAIISQKMNDALEQKKVEIAQSLYSNNTDEESEEDQDTDEDQNDSAE